ncbi:MAG: hypothetical protein NT059_11935, partial [Planctomycetota bacterium]|nr:hypothetical protein [Planctomycetota bacterium]
RPRPRRGRAAWSRWPDRRTPPPLSWPSSSLLNRTGDPTWVAGALFGATQGGRGSLTADKSTTVTNRKRGAEFVSDKPDNDGGFGVYFLQVKFVVLC